MFIFSWKTNTQWHWYLLIMSSQYIENYSNSPILWFFLEYREFALFFSRSISAHHCQNAEQHYFVFVVHNFLNYPQSVTRFFCPPFMTDEWRYHSLSSSGIVDRAWINEQRSQVCIFQFVLEYMMEQIFCLLSGNELSWVYFLSNRRTTTHAFRSEFLHDWFLYTGMSRMCYLSPSLHFWLHIILLLRVSRTSKHGVFMIAMKKYVMWSYLPFFLHFTP